ncbi:MAG: exodeoxyribonuclease V subunit gamma, partial [Cellulomonas sp.]|nr:exodeoxyribonuclease V subunit gamma [Cellulomonas sp.]
MGQDSAPGRLVVHVAEQADVLADGLADLLSAPPDDPFAPELVAVETSGVGRWVAQQLSHRLGATGAADGISAQIRFDPWWRVVAQVLAGVVGLERRDDPWHPDRLVWQVLAAVDDHLDEPWLAVVRHHLGDDPADEVRRGRRLQVARHVAGLFTAYDARRPALLADWASGQDTDGTGAPLADDLVWQAQLWRTVADRLTTPAPSQRLAEAADRLHDDPGLAALPPRLSVFAPAALPDAHLRLLGALAAHREVHLWLVHPSATLWQRVAGQAALQTGPVRRRDLPTLARHRLLASMARPATELQLRVAPLAGQVIVTPAPPRPTTLLGAVQQAIADDGDGSTDRPELSTADRSVQVHACHGRTRQVEVLRDVLTRLFADDPTLEPRDVVVLCPDVAGFAPLIEAVFDPADEAVDSTVDSPAPGDQTSHPGRSLRVRVADRASGGQPTNPLLGVLQRLLALASSRVTASAVLDLARTDPVRRRFTFDDDALARLQTWTAESGVHWGENAARRARYHVQHQQGTWAAGLDRLLLGVAMAEDDQRFLGAVLPVDDVSSADVDLVGRWTELLDRLTGLLAQLSGTHPVAHWLDTCATALALLTDTTPTDRWQQVEAAQVLARVSERVADDGVPLRLADVVARLRPALAGRDRRSGYRNGALTVCGFAPLRAVPHRVVVLLGLDGGAFPRRGAPDGDDVTARDPLVGEPDPRAVDRQLFLD